jgi:hypothetical protein
MKKMKVTYKGGGRVKKLKSKVMQRAGKTAEGDTKIQLNRSEGLDKAAPKNQAAESKDRTEGAKDANVKIKSLIADLRALSPEEKNGEKGKAIKNQLRILRDSKRGKAAGDSSVAMNKKGEVYKA